uniref:Putative restriction alleviation protein n=1 Tax=viral metagenome TaxID=1070528 RepID=A0A6M3LKY8_9ZZZZ
MNIVETFKKREYQKPCPKCGSWDIIPQTPIKIDITREDLVDPKKVLGKWAREIRLTGGILEGPCFIMCRNCGHKGPSVDCSGRTSEDVGKDPKVYSEIKKLWIEQPKQGNLGE